MLWLFNFHFRVVVLESRPTDNPTANSNLYILAGHENSYWEERMAGSSPDQRTLLLQQHAQLAEIAQKLQ